MNTVFLQCFWLLFLRRSLCVAGPQHGTSYGRNTTQLGDEDDPSSVLQFRFWSNSTAACSSALSKPGQSVTLSYRTEPDSDNWILLEPLNTTLDASSCVNLSVVTQRLNFSAGIQFRFVQEEHAGGYCNCWGISDLKLTIVHNGTTHSINASENLCSNTGQNYSRMGGCDDLVDLVLCGGSASVPRGVVTRFIPVSPLVTDINCFDGQLVDDIGPSPVCDSDIPDTLYISIRFQLYLFQNGRPCNRLDKLDEGVEFSVKTGESDHWIPLVFYSTSEKRDKRTRFPVSVGTENNSMLSLRGYSVPIELINSSTTQDIRMVRVCGNNFFKRGVQFRWLQTVRVKTTMRDVWSLDNVTVAVHINSTHERQVVSEDFEEENINFHVKAGNVSDGDCSLSGQSLVFGLESPIAEFESRIGVTPLLDLRLCAERNEPTNNTLLSACDEGPVSHPSSSSLFPTPASSYSFSSPSFSSPFPFQSSSSPFSSPTPSFFSPSSFLFSSFFTPFSSPSYYPPTSSSLFFSSPSPYPSPISSFPSPSPSFFSQPLSFPSPYSSPTPSSSSLSPSTPSSCSPSPSLSTPSSLCENSTDLFSLFRSVSMLLDNITPENFDEVLKIIRDAVRLAVTGKQGQTTSNLAIVAAAIAQSAQIINESTVIPNATADDMINVLEDLQQWNVDVLRRNASNIVQSFEVIVSTFAQQLITGNPFPVMTESIFFVAEWLSHTELAINGTAFSSSDQIGSINTTTLGANETAAAFLPPSLFKLISNHTEVGTFFAVYNSGVLFPVTNETQMLPETNSTVTTVIGSPVLAATVGRRLNFSGLADPVRILLQINQELENFTNPRCVSWDFDLEDWTTQGCETDVNGEVVTCNCNHLTNFAILVDIYSRFQDCQPSGVLGRVLEVFTIIGVVLSLIGIVATVITLLLFKKLRKRDTTKFHIQLCIALFCMLIVFVAGIDKTDVYGGCVTASALIHYFTLVAVMWMGAEAVLMFQKLIIVFHQTTTKFIVGVSLICWVLPIIPVVIPLAVDLSDAVSRDLVTRKSTAEIKGFCFVFDRAVFFGAFLGPIFAILFINIVIFIMVIGVLIKHTQNKLNRTKAQMSKKTAIRLLISTTSIMFLFGLTWLVGALTILGFADSRASTALQVLFVILNASQGFFIFLFFCVLSKDARQLWLQLMPCVRYKSKTLNPSQASKSTLKADTAVTDSTLTSAAYSKSEYNSSTNNLSKERYTDIPLHLTATELKVKPSVVTVDLESSDLEGNEKRASAE